jgi:hypothetical protein
VTTSGSPSPSLAVAEEEEKVEMDCLVEEEEEVLDCCTEMLLLPSPAPNKISILNTYKI